MFLLFCLLEMFELSTSLCFVGKGGQKVAIFFLGHSVTCHEFSHLQGWDMTAQVLDGGYGT